MLAVSQYLVFLFLFQAVMWRLRAEVWTHGWHLVVAETGWNQGQAGRRRQGQDQKDAENKHLSWGSWGFPRLSFIGELSR